MTSSTSAWRGRGDEAQAEALQIVEGIAEGVDLELAAIAGAGIDLTDRQRAAEPAARGTVERCARARLVPLVGRGRRLGEGGWSRLLNRSLRMRNPSEVVARVGAVEGFVAQREIGDDVAFDRRLQQRPLEPGRIAQMAAATGRPARAAARRERRRETFDQRHAFAARLGGWIGIDADRAPPGSPSRICSMSARLCSTSSMRTHTRASTSPSWRTGTSKSSSRIGRIARRLARIEGAARGAADVAAGAVLAGQLGASECPL